MKVAGHQKVIGCPALRRSAESRNKTAGDRPPPAQRGASLFPAQRNGCEPYGVQRRYANILVGDAAESPPKFVGGIAEQGRRCAERQVFTPPADCFLHRAHCHPGRGAQWLRGRRLSPRSYSSLKVVSNEMKDFGSGHVCSSISLRRPTKHLTQYKRMK